jgi:hypothetical protein
MNLQQQAESLFLFKLYMTHAAPKHREVCGPKKNGRVAFGAWHKVSFCEQGLAKKNSTYQLHPPGVEPEPIAWKAIILPLDQECFDEVSNKLIDL